MPLAETRSPCKDVVDYDNGEGLGCAEYEGQGWCVAGALRTNHSGPTYRFPERNCCACGKAAPIRARNGSIASA